MTGDKNAQPFVLRESSVRLRYIFLCGHPIFDGITYKHIESVLESEHWVFERRAPVRPVIESFNYLAALLGTIGRHTHRLRVDRESGAALVGV